MTTSNLVAQFNDLASRIRGLQVDKASSIQDAIKICAELIKVLEHRKDSITDQIIELKKRKSELEEVGKEVGTEITFSEDFVRKANEILIEEIQKAVSSSPEFNHPVFIEPLINAFSRPEAISIEIRGKLDLSDKESPSKLLRKVKIRINAEEVGGTLDDLGNAITFARNSLHYGKKLKGELATVAWYYGLYVPAREGSEDAKEKKINLYWDIIRARMESLAGKPAYWYLLNYGNVGVSGGDNTPALKLSSDKGGYGKPVNPPTHFIDKAKDRILAVAGEFIRTVKKELRVDTTEIDEEIALLQNKRDEFTKVIGKFEEILRELRKFDWDEREKIILKINAATEYIIKNHLKKIDTYTYKIKRLDIFAEERLKKFIVDYFLNRKVPGRLYLTKIKETRRAKIDTPYLSPYWTEEYDFELRLRTKSILDEIKRFRPELDDVSTAILEQMSNGISNFLRYKRVTHYSRSGHIITKEEYDKRSKLISQYSSQLSNITADIFLTKNKLNDVKYKLEVELHTISELSKELQSLRKFKNPPQKILNRIVVITTHLKQLSKSTPRLTEEVKFLEKRLTTLLEEEKKLKDRIKELE